MDGDPGRIEVELNQKARLWPHRRQLTGLKQPRAVAVSGRGQQGLLNSSSRTAPHHCHIPARWDSASSLPMLKKRGAQRQ